MSKDLRQDDLGEVASRRMTNLAAFLLASLGIVTAAFVLLDVGTGPAAANIGQVLVMLAMVAASATPAVLAAVSFSRRPAIPAARTFAMLVALGHGALGLFGAWAGWATKNAVSGEARDTFSRLQVIGAISVVLSVATLLALRLAGTASGVTAREDRSDGPSRRDLAVQSVLPNASRSAQRVAATTRTPRSRLPVWLVPLAIAAAAAGVAVGVWADWTFPNPVYGVQVILLAGTSLIVAVSVLLRNLGQIGRAFAVSSVALLVGSIGGLVLSPPAIIYVSGTMTLRVDHPEPMVVTGVAICEVHTLTDELSVQGDLGEGPPARPGLVQVYLASGYAVDDPIARDDGLDLAIRVENAETDVGGSEVGATPDSTLEMRTDDTGGTLRFANLHAAASGGPAWLTSPALEGSVEWSCADASGSLPRV